MILEVSKKYLVTVRITNRVLFQILLSAMQHGPRVNYNLQAIKIRNLALFFTSCPHASAVLTAQQKLHFYDMLSFIKVVGKFCYYDYFPQSRTGSFA